MQDDITHTHTTPSAGPAQTSQPIPPAFDGPPPPPGGWQAWEQRQGQPPRPEGRGRFPWYIPVIGGCLVLLMIPIIIAAVLAGIAGAIAVFSQEASSTTSQSFAVTGAPTIVLHGNAAAIRIISGPARQVTMQTTKTVRAISRGAAQRELDAMRVTATQTGNTIDVTLSWPDDLHWFPSYTQRSLDVTITAPSTTNVSASLNAGDLHVDTITGNLDIQANAGNLVLEGVTLTGTSSLGGNAGNVDCTCALAAGAALDVHMNAGHVTLTLPANTQAHLDASVNAGDISIDGWPITPTRTEFGPSVSASGDLGAHPNGNITIRLNAGSVNIGAD